MKKRKPNTLNSSNQLTVIIEPKKQKSTFTTFISFLLNSAPCINKTMAFLSEGVQTRNSFLKQTSSCKLWQLRLMLLYRFGRDSNLFSEILEFCKYPFDQTQMMLATYTPLQDIQKVIAHITINYLTPEKKYTYLYSLIGLNSPFVTPRMKQITRMDDLPMVPYKLYPLCLYVNKPIDDFLSSISMIDHFFTVFRDETYYYLNSSYGSDYVCIPQQTIKFLPDEFKTNFTALCVILGKEPANRSAEDIVTLPHLLTIFFLNNGMQKRVNDNTVKEYPKLSSEWITPDEGHKTEIKQIYIENKYSYLVGWMTNYDTELDKVITTMQQQGGNRKRKTQMRRKRNNKTKKRYM